MFSTGFCTVIASLCNLPGSNPVLELGSIAISVQFCASFTFLY
jgi:hypothetical protein